MFRSRRIRAAAAAVIASAATASIALGGDLIPREVVFGNPERAGLQISPDGLHLAFIAPREGVMNVWVQSVDKSDAKPITAATDRPIRQFFWAQNSDQIIYLQDRGGDENWRLYAVAVDDGAEVELSPFDNVQARPQGADRQFPDEILVAVNNRNPQLHDVYRVNTRTGERTLVYENTDGFASVTADSDFQIRLGSRFTPDGGIEVFLRPTSDAEWTRFAHWDQQDSMTSGPLGFSREGSTLYTLDSTGVDKAALYSIDLSAAESRQELVASSDEADISNVVFDPGTGKPQAAAWEFAREEWTILDPSIKPDWDYLKGVEDGEMAITSRDDADDTWTIAYVVDDGPVKYYLYDRTAKKATYLFSNRPALEQYELAKMTPVVIKSRDGLNLVSYLTTPVGAPKRDLPMVLLVHGGPWGRDSWGYNGASSVARQPGLRGAQRQLPRLHRHGQAFHQRGEPRVGGEDARRPDRCRQLGGR